MKTKKILIILTILVGVMFIIFFLRYILNKENPWGILPINGFWFIFCLINLLGWDEEKKEEEKKI